MIPRDEQIRPAGGVHSTVVDRSLQELRRTVSGGFAVVQPNSALSINAVEAYPIEDFSSEAVKAQIAEATKVANGSGSEQDIAEAKIELEASWDLSRFSDMLLTSLTRFWRACKLF